MDKIQAIKDCRNCKYGNYNDHWDTYFCYNNNVCSSWELWEPKEEREVRIKTNGDLISRHSVSAWLYNCGYEKLSNCVMDKERFPSCNSKRMELVQMAIDNLMSFATGDTIVDKAFRNSARYIQEAINCTGKYPSCMKVDKMHEECHLFEDIPGWDSKMCKLCFGEFEKESAKHRDD